MESQLLIQALVNGIMLGMVYVLVALGLTLVFSIMEVINFAHGEFYMLGGYTAYYLIAQLGLNYFLTIAAAVVVVGFLGWMIEKLLFRPFRKDLLGAFIVSLGLVWVLQSAAMLAFGSLEKSVPSPFRGVLKVLGIYFSLERLIVTVTAIVLVAALYLFIQFSREGRAMRAVAQDSDAAALQGINVARISSLAFAVGAGLAATAGVLIAPLFFVSPFIGDLPIVKAFIIIILGGMGSIPGALLGGLILGLAEGVGSIFLSIPAVNLLGFVIVMAVLLVRPRGLLGHA
ncbi:MAG: branched-chain amino acid ABC transporter permease [Candidatus Rokubacteria bacterium]|nr:branched-chain amino acid ABC transporter permease [Candidatus Rokubacteria bacterium]